jgi:putative GTP pyrophosphokinase
VRSYLDTLLDHEINYENLVAYLVERFPTLPVSSRWTRELLKDMDKDRYKTIRDIDRELNYAKSKVDEYAKEQPNVFRYSTDFLTKSLIFVDSQFRKVHNVGAETLAAAERADITRY